MQMQLGLPVAADDSTGPVLQLSNKSLRNTEWHGSFENEMTIYYYVTLCGQFGYDVKQLHTPKCLLQNALRVWFAFILFLTAIKL